MHTEKVRAAPFVLLAQECVLAMQLQAEICKFVMSKKGLKNYIAFSYMALRHRDNKSTLIHQDKSFKSQTVCVLTVDWKTHENELGLLDNFCGTIPNYKCCAGNTFGNGTTACD
jgi:hypothetical protein